MKTLCSRMVVVVAAVASITAATRASAQGSVQTPPAPGVVEPGGPLPTPTPPPYAQPGSTQVQYVYVPAGADPQRVAMLNARLFELQSLQAQYRSGGPIALVVIGSVVTSMSGLGAMGFGLARAVSSDDFGPSGTNLVRGTRVTGALMLGGVVMIGVGSAKLNQRRRLRSQWDPEIFQIHQELRMLQLSAVGLRLTPEFAGCEARFSF